MRVLTLQVTIHLRFEGGGFSVAVGKGLPRRFEAAAEVRAYVGSLGGDLRDLDAWLAAIPSPEQAERAGPI